MTMDARPRKGGKRDRRDRKDAYYVGRSEDMSEVVAYLAPTKLANATLFSIPVDMTAVLDFVEEEKAAGQNISMFTTLVASAVRLCAMRPNVNRFVKNSKLYERKVISMGYIIASSVDDSSKRSLTTSVFDPSSTVYDVAEAIGDGVCRIRSGEKWGTERPLNKVARLPSPLKRLVAWALMGMDRRGWVPSGLVATDPCSSTVFISNLGSIGGISVFHHMFEWGTNSIFVTMGKIRQENTIGDDGKVKKVPIMDLSVTVDDRISDGVYMSNSIKVWMDLLANPQVLRDKYMHIRESDGENAAE